MNNIIDRRYVNEFLTDKDRAFLNNIGSELMKFNKPKDYNLRLQMVTNLNLIVGAVAFDLHASKGKKLKFTKLFKKYQAKLLDDS